MTCFAPKILQWREMGRCPPDSLARLSATARPSKFSRCARRAASPGWSPSLTEPFANGSRPIAAALSGKVPNPQPGPSVSERNCRLDAPEQDVFLSCAANFCVKSTRFLPPQNVNYLSKTLYNIYLPWPNQMALWMQQPPALREARRHERCAYPDRSRKKRSSP